MQYFRAKIKSLRNRTIIFFVFPKFYKLNFSFSNLATSFPFSFLPFFLQRHSTRQTAHRTQLASSPARFLTDLRRRWLLLSPASFARRVHHLACIVSSHRVHTPPARRGCTVHMHHEREPHVWLTASHFLPCTRAGRLAAPVRILWRCRCRLATPVQFAIPIFPT